MTKSNLSRKKLKAIVFTDIADFTSISAQDEQKALELIQKQNDIIKPIVEKHNGEWLKEIGDGLLFSFDSSLEAVRCSIEIQETLKEIEDLHIRIGIHQGDIFIKDGDIFGDDVNIASRVEGFAPIGGISLSDKIHKDISGVSDIKTSFIGHRKLKGVEQETKIRCITSHNLPKHKTNIFPQIAYYFNTAIGLMSLFMASFVTYLILIDQENGFAQASTIGLTEGDMVILTIKEGLMYILLGYTSLSYYKGISNKSQKAMVYFSYGCMSLFVLEEMLLPFIFQEEGSFTFYIFLISSLIIVSIYQIISNIYTKRKLSPNSTS